MEPVQDGTMETRKGADSRPLIVAGSGHRYGAASSDVLVMDTGRKGAGEVQLQLVTKQSPTSGTTVYVQVVFMKLGEIDTVKETFTADVFIQARWREPKLDGRHTAKEMKPETIKWEEFWNPKLYIHNSIGALQETVSRTVVYDVDTWEAYIAERRRAKGTFIENLELFAFPFDTQDITIKAASERSDEELTLLHDPINISTINTDMFIDEQEWRLYDEVGIFRETISAVFDGNVSRTAPHTAVCCRTHASRRPGFYVTNILVVMLFIYGITFSTFAVDYIKRENRLQLTFILLLTTIAFKNTTSSSLPRISYFTSMDIYIVLSMTIMILICVWHAIVPTIFKVYGDDVAKTSDMAVLIGLGCLYALVQIIFALAVSIPYFRRKAIYEGKERDHKRQIQNIKAAGPSTLLDVRVASVLQR